MSIRTTVEPFIIPERELADLVLDQMDTAVLICDKDTKIVLANPAAQTLFGGDPIGKLFPEAFSLQWANREVQPETVGAHEDAAFSLEEVFKGQALRGWCTLERADHSPRDVMVNTSPYRGPLDEILCCIVTLTDVTAQKQIARAANILSTSLDFNETLENIARLAVPSLGDWCAVHIVSEDGMIRRLAFAHRDPARVARIVERPQKYPLDKNAVHLVPYVIATGETEFYNQVTETILLEAARDADHLETLRSLGLSAYLCIPLRARGRTLGAVTFAMSDSGRHYSESDVELAHDLVRRAGLAADNAWLYQESQAGQARLQLVAEVSSELTASLDFENQMQRLAQLVVPRFADWCAINLLEKDGTIRLAALSHHNDALLPTIRAWAEQQPLSPDADAGTPHVIRTGMAEWVPDVTHPAAQDPVGFPVGDARPEEMQQILAHSYMIVPLVARGRVFGAITFVLSTSERFYGFQDLYIGEELARRAAIAMDNAALFAREQHARRQAEENEARIATLHQLTAALATALTETQVVDVVLERGLDALGAQAGSISVLDAAHHQVETLGAIGYPPEMLSAWRVYSLDTHAPIADAIRAGEIILIEDEEMFKARYPIVRAQHPLVGKTWAAVPLIVKGGVLGALGLTWKEPRSFELEDIAFMTALAQQTASAFERARLYRDEREARRASEREQQRSELLASISASLASSLEVEETLQQVARAILPGFGDFAIVDIVRDEELEPIAVAHIDPADEEIAWQLARLYHPRLDDPNSPSGRAARTGQVGFYPEVSATAMSEGGLGTPQAQQLFEQLQPRSSLVLPLTVRGYVLGVLNVGYAKSGRQYEPADVAFGQEIARRAAVALENARLYQAEQVARTTAEQNAARLGALQRITAALVPASTPEEVGNIVLEQGLAALGAQGGVLAELQEDLETVEILSSVGYDPENIETWRKFSTNSELAIAEAIRSGEMLVFGSPEELAARYPQRDIRPRRFAAWLIAPLQIKGRILGGLVLAFDRPRIFSDADRALALALARQGATALERARLYESERVAREAAELAAQRSDWLTEASHVLSSTLDSKAAFTQLAHLAVPSLADWCAIDVAKGDGTAEQLVMAHSDPAKEEWARDYVEEIRQYFTPNWDAPMGLPNVLRTGRSEIYYDIPDSLLQQVTENQVQLNILRSIGYSSVMVVPLNAGGKTLGAITLVNAESRRHFTDNDLAFTELLASRAAVAFENARLYSDLQTLNAELEKRVEQRTFELSEAYNDLSKEVVERTRAEEMTRALLRISSKLNSTLDSDTSLEILIQEAMRVLDGTAGFAGLRTPQGMEVRRFIANGKSLDIKFTWERGKGMPGWVLEHAVPYVTNDARNDPIMLHHLPFNQEVRAAICTPILDAQGQVMGFFEVRDKADNAPFTGADVEFLTALSPIASIAIENSQAYRKISEAETAVKSSYAQLRALAARLQTIREEERTDIARELHDELGQALTALKMDLAGLIARFPKRNAFLHERAKAMSEQIDQTIKTVRRMSSQLRPGMLDDLGLGPSMEWYGQEFQARTGIQAEVLVPGEDLPLSHAQATALYRIFQETLTNVARHANATQIHANLTLEPQAILLEIADNGKGIDLEHSRGTRSLGLLGMRERAEMVQGTLEIQGEPGKGTTVTVRVPLNSPNGEHP